MIHRIVNPAKALRTLRKTHVLLGATLRDVSQKQAETARDGPDGWSVLVVVCHLRDYEHFFAERIALLLAADQPVFAPWSQEALVRQHNYVAQNMRAVLDDLFERRNAVLAQLETLDDQQWLRVGFHPEQGPGTLLDVAINAGLHDLDHLEQITRCLLEAE